MASISVWGKPLTEQGWASGDLLRALTGGSPNAFTPYAPPPIPSGYYDPNLDATRQAASRGLLNTQQDIGLAGRRAGEDYGLDPNDPTYAGSQVAGINRGYTRGTEDIATQRRYTDEDYNRNVGLLTRQYTQLGRQQAEGARKYGVTSGGIALLSAAKRAENQGIDRQSLDTGRTRAMEGFDTTGRRLTEDRDVGLGQARTIYDRGVADRGTALGRAQGEDTFFGLDTDAQKQFQAQQAGYQAPTGPSNEFTKPDGTRYRVVLKGGYRYEYDQNGRVLNKRRA